MTGKHISLQDYSKAPVLALTGYDIMSWHLMLSQTPPIAAPGGIWRFVVLVLLILFVTLVASDGSKNRDR